jgi:hypothetical protein
VTRSHVIIGLAPVIPIGKALNHKQSGGRDMPGHDVDGVSAQQMTTGRVPHGGYQDFART